MRSSPGLFVTGPATSAGKTFVSRALVRALALDGRRVAALKPIETGLDLDPSGGPPRPLDAVALARASRRLSSANFPGFYRALPPLSPYAASLVTGGPPPDLDRLCAAIAEAAATPEPAEFLIVEGAGGLLVPLDPKHTIADLAMRLALPLLIVARDELGVLSHVLTTVECATHRGLSIRGVVLTPATAPNLDPATEHNAAILRERLPCPVLCFPHSKDNDDALAQAAHVSNLLTLTSL